MQDDESQFFTADADVRTEARLQIEALSRSGEPISGFPSAAPPVRPSQELMPRTRTPVSEDVDPQGDVSVIIVDDMPVFRSAASAVIQSTPGFRLVGEASSGEEAIELVTQHAPDLVLLDVHMPRLDGVTTARHIAQIERTPITVLLSADEAPEVAADPRAHGVAAFLLKQKLGPRTLCELWATHGNSVGARDDQTTPANYTYG